jgi:hypothetical protein
MEVFWLVIGIATLGLTIYFYVNDMHPNEIKYFFMAGAMAIVLSIFRMMYRKNVPKNLNQQKKTKK